MSIINDALKKAEKIKNKISEGKGPGSEKVYSEEPQGPVQKKSASQGSVSKKGKNIITKKNSLLVLGAACAISFIIITFAMLLIKSPLQPSAPQLSGKEISASDEINNPLAADENSQELLLTGIVHGEGVPMVVLSGSVYMEGDFVKEFRVIKISKDSVILEKDGQIKELRVR
ncbi:MAG: hypothetical protein ABH843_01735 [Candidatus Omnitrophota bacterium]